MTVIAWDGRYVAADSLETFGSCRASKPVVKLQLRGTVLFGLTGTAALLEPMIEWYLAGCKIDDLPKVADDRSRLLVFREGKAHCYTMKVPYPVECYAVDAWGTAAEVALGAMDAGVSAEKAVEIAIARDVWCGGPVQVVDLHSLPGWANGGDA